MSQQPDERRGAEKFRENGGEGESEKSSVMTRLQGHEVKYGWAVGKNFPRVGKGLQRGGVNIWPLKKGNPDKGRRLSKNRRSLRGRQT